MVHAKAHPLANQKVGIVKGQHKGKVFEVQDWADRLPEGTVLLTDSFIYKTRREEAELPYDQEIVYGKIGHFTHLVHATELDTKKYQEPVPTPPKENDLSKDQEDRPGNDKI